MKVSDRNIIGCLMALSLIVGLAIGSLMFTSKANAASETECAIFLCLPQGFPGEHCKAAKSKFKQRMRKMQPPTPPLSACLVSSGSVTSATGEESEIESNLVNAAVIKRTGESVVYIDGVKCTEDMAEYPSVFRPEDCIGNQEYVAITSDGELLGDRYFHRPMKPPIKINVPVTSLQDEQNS